MALGTVTGAVIGYVFYYFIGCQGGCPLSSNWLSTTIFGGIFGFIMFYPEKKKQDDKETE